MSNYEVDVPVLLFVFRRPDKIAETFNAIKKAKPSKLYLVSDGPREGNQIEKENIEKSRLIVENVDWECQVFKLYYNENQGMYNMFIKALDFVFESEKYCIVLEDDVVASESFFRYSKELLDKYQNDTRISMICGMNHMGEYGPDYADYFFANHGSIWGFSIWKRTYDLFYDLTYNEDPFFYNLIKENAKKTYGNHKLIEGYLKNYNYEGHIPGPEFYLGLILASQSQLLIIPKKNMINNVGNKDGSTHFSNYKYLNKNIKKLFNMETYEIEFPIRHPKYIVSDNHYNKQINKILGKTFIRRIYRKIESKLKMVINSIIKIIDKD